MGIPTKFSFALSSIALCVCSCDPLCDPPFELEPGTYISSNWQPIIDAPDGSVFRMATGAVRAKIDQDNLTVTFSSEVSGVVISETWHYKDTE